MEIKLGKYEFKSEEQALEKIQDLGVETDFEGNEYPTHKHAIVLLGHIMLEQGEYGDNLEEIKAPILSDKYHVDVVWNGLESHPYGWKTYSVDLESEGMHKFAGISYLENKM